IPAVSTLHFIAPRHAQSRSARVQRPVYRAMLRRMDAIIAVSDAVRSYALEARGAGGPSVYVVHNGLHDVVATAADERLIAPPEGVVLYAGRLSPEKQPALLMEAMAPLRVHARLWLAGRGPEHPG